MPIGRFRTDRGRKTSRRTREKHPYDNLIDLPDDVRNDLPVHAREVCRVAFDEEQYDEKNVNGDWISTVDWDPRSVV